ncbi:MULTISPECIES: hypothetical protein [Pantoea]|jgi:hypothetical protein|uniref:Uncharacterized protein n=1 Tax=Pantoea piersonii TaxID=2364647 RepID=A0AAJ5QLG6_9GAMM|nr:MULTISPECIES: hypothetical protein [Pantoea]MDU6432181.1 hypothetical protein [Pantoea sp.]MBZ6387870.1 hypothetical protein [Pantoea piersonii]MBZ6401526.1 hypothetical protein [Pantoea piersonii]MBZ6409037.1 hypothetical protein [Pantoea piersonii]MBZ6428436.1 hypothetical protein [Pantoea piersonii]
MVAETLDNVSFNLDSLENAALEICKTKGMLGMLLASVSADIQQSYFQLLRESGFDDELVWLQQVLDTK